MKTPDCDFCSLVSGICVECGGCFGEHCQCDPCQHGKARADECVFCGRGFGPSEEQLQASLDWLFKAQPSPDQELP